MGAFLLHLVGIFDLTTLVKEYPCLGLWFRNRLGRKCLTKMIWMDMVGDG